MIYTLIAFLIVIAVAGCAMTVFPRRVQQSDDERKNELFTKARLMFPSAENDIFALDALYQHTFRELLIAHKNGKPERETLNRDSILIFNIKNNAINDAVRFEEQYIKTPPSRRGIIHREDYTK